MSMAEWEFYALCYRLKTLRTKERNKKKAKEKELIRRNKRWAELCTNHRRKEYIDLVPPIQKGWKRFFVLREDIAKSEEAAFLQQLLDKINVTTYSMRKDFKVKAKQKGRKVYVPTEQEFPVISRWHMKALKLSEKEFACFELEDRWYAQEVRKVYVFQNTWKFKLKIAPYFITQLMKIDPTIMSEDRHIENWFGEERRCKMLKLKDGNVRKFFNYKEQEKMKYRSLFKIEPVSVLEAEWFNEQKKENEQ